MVGIGFDVHQLGIGESLILGGVKIDSTFGTIAHSDGDVLLHAVMDALLGAVGMGDIGEHFPDTDNRYKDYSSLEMLKQVVNKFDEGNYQIINIDIAVVLEAPKIMKYKNEMCENISRVCGIPKNRVNIKATTNEKMGYVGRGEGVAVYAVSEVQFK
ncbi:MAG: 2-C-methyl-D-erythritol 2,4-cyclodiphosphate synthase [Candidatus Kapabacteria bacterium]|nr:2-C-methyl-D-erythritol 2,4-cyclodiphosphate synthase [Candidatus Kapabacteria bacterium]